MNVIPSVFVVAGLFAATSPAQAKIERVVEKSFTVSAAGALRLETYGGAISVMPGAEGVVKITAREKINADSEPEADELLKWLELTFDQAGNDVHAVAKYDRSGVGFHFGSTPVSVEFVATVPASYATDLHTSGGSVTVGDLQGAAKIRTSGGQISLGKLGGKVDAKTSGGNISLTEARDEVKLDTSGGAITVGRVAGPADLSTSGGSIRIDAVEQRINADTSGGNVRAGIVGPLKGDCILRTSGGGVHVTVDKAAAYHLDASTSGGSVDAKGITLTLDSTHHERSKLAGDVNGGGPLLKLRSSGGNIVVEPR